jgi:hypothetical protein
VQSTMEVGECGVELQGGSRRGRVNGGSGGGGG